jgi:hypothetical protein
MLAIATKSSATGIHRPEKSAADKTAITAKILP